MFRFFGQGSDNFSYEKSVVKKGLDPILDKVFREKSCRQAISKAGRMVLSTV